MFVLGGAGTGRVLRDGVGSDSVGDGQGWREEADRCAGGPSFDHQEGGWGFEGEFFAQRKPLEQSDRDWVGLQLQVVVVGLFLSVIFFK